ncbi:MAG: glycosyltransferase family 4 protein [Calditrichaeota bacterium]|nr:glycosyltransferase family 4 protein [Calditrichota bacterium]
MAALLGRMLQTTDFKFACASFGKVRNIQTSRDDRVECFVIPKKGDEHDLKLCRDLVNEWQPDLIHIHGTERAYGLLTARSMVRCPTIISLQGLMGPYSEWYRYFGNRTLLEIFRMHRWLDIPAFRGQWMGFLNYRKSAKREREIIQGNQFFMGRTAWDRAQVRALNPSAHYCYEGRLLREAFWQKRWELGRAKRHRIIFTNAIHPRKGTEILLDALRLMKSDYPDIQVCIAGAISSRSGYGRYLRRRMVEFGDAVIELGALNAEEMTEELTKSHVFVSPSFIENSPNAVSEAQLLGMPVVSTYTGGVPSLIEEGQTGLFFPTDDVPMLAARLREIFEDDSLAVRLAEQAHSVASQRHDPDTVVKQCLHSYDYVLKKLSGKTC